ncbi:MAG: thioredoxin domain-containing protein [Desulfurococcales archaeon]|nr:thioredoxin domain-containing protein [Desulfurococcales archaeon]
MTRDVNCDRPNRLARERSPYLRMHACNPVDWYPWGEEALEAAKRLDKPLHISIGYSSCHWCHVMARESFEDPEVASVLNEVFVNVKVDREERPDIDRYYMTYCQAVGEGCGWPLTVVATPDGRPFFVATYLPRSRLLGLAEAIKRAWREERGKIEEIAGESARAVASWLLPRGREEELPVDLASRAYNALRSSFDATFGGFGYQPKFPNPTIHLFLLRYWRFTGVIDSLVMVERTLKSMILGGIRDHVGGGFHRYSTDRYWILPHFEKMLYDQGSMILVLSEAYQATGDREYLDVAMETLEFLRREMLGSEGGFYSSIDSESNGVEGLYYTWTLEELSAALSGDDLEIAVKAFNVSSEGNYREEATRRKTGRNVLYMGRPLEALARELGMGERELELRLGRIKENLRRFREEEKPRPMVDTKVLADWNGLAIAGVSRLSFVTGDVNALKLGLRAATFIREKMMDGSSLYHAYKDGEAYIDGMLDDYGLVLWGLLEAYQASSDPGILGDAVELARETVRRFWDDQIGFRATPRGVEPQMAGEVVDGAYPQGVPVASYALARLSRITGEKRLEEVARRALKVHSEVIAGAPHACAMALAVNYYIRGPTREVVIVPGRGFEEVMEAARKRYLPDTVFLVKRPGLEDVAPYTRSMTSLGGKATVYVCENQTCRLPVTSPSDMLRLLGEK